MSLATFKRKSINYCSSATKRSGKPPGGYWLPQGPFGPPFSLSSVMQKDEQTAWGKSGFSLQGSHRSISVGKDMKQSQSGTPFRGIYAMGAGGCCGHYVQTEPLLNAGYAKIEARGNQWEFIKPSVLSTRGMLRKRFRWAYNGQYPNAWVQPIYTGNQTDTVSQGLYVQNISASNNCRYDVNNTANYENYFRVGGPTGCATTPARGYTLGIQQSIAPYTKTLHIPKDASAHTLRIQRRCQNPTGTQKPFPYAVQTGTGILRGGINVSNVGSTCFTSNTTLVPPSWYTSPQNPSQQ